MSRKMINALREELNRRMIAIARLEKQGTVSARIEADRLSKDLGYIRLALEVWG